MTAYLFNEGSFDSLDVGIVDSTTHNLQLEDGSRVVVERRTLRDGATIEALARDRTQHEARERARYRVVAERPGPFEGYPGFDVAACYEEAGDVRYQLRRHIGLPAASFVFTLSAPPAAREALDVRMDRLFGGLRIGDPGAFAPGCSPTRYVTHDLSFDLDEAFDDLTIHEIDAPLPGPEGRVFSLLIDREPFAGAATTFADVVRHRLREDAIRLFHHRVLDVRQLRIPSPRRDEGHPAFAVVFGWAVRGRRYHGRQLHVLAGDKQLCFSATAPRDDQGACDQYFDNLIETLTLDAEDRDGS